MMELFADPHVWLGLLTLVVLEVILGIDNLVFIAILADKLPEHQRDRARVIGLSLALIMRLLLLASISWLVTLTTPLFELFDHGFSGRDLILLVGGLFLLTKATMELHERVEGGGHHSAGPRPHAAFGVVIAQIVALDAVFSLDAVITAVGMVDELWVMMTAVVIAIALMIVASKPLTNFVNRHPTVVVLCLGFLLMIGLSLIAEGFGFHIPKGYLYAAIGFSVLIEAVNQWARFNRTKAAMSRPLRERTADAVLRLLGGRMAAEAAGPLTAITAGAGAVFAPAERQMIRRVLDLSEHRVGSVMTPRHEVVWLDLDDDEATQIETLKQGEHSRLLVARGELDALEGVVQSRDLLRGLLDGGRVDVTAMLAQPLTVPESASALRVVEQLRKHPVPLAVVVDEYGGIEGIVTASDILAAIAGDLPDTVDEAGKPERVGEDAWLVPGSLLLTELERLLKLPDLPSEKFLTVGGLALAELDHIPAVGETFEFEGWRFEVKELDGRRVRRVFVSRVPSATA